MQMSVKRSWNDTDGGNRSTGRQTCSHSQRRNMEGEEQQGEMPHPQNVLYVRTVFLGLLS
jgi:hypothetical protein